VNDHAADAGPFGEVAMGPDVVESGEIGRVVFLAVRIVPETDRHGRKRLGADQFTLFAGDGLAVVVPDLDGHAETRTLDLAAPDRQRRIAEHEAGNDVGAAGDRGQVHVGLDALIDKGKAFRRQRRPGRGEQPER
jgi:hypothetical protein